MAMKASRHMKYAYDQARMDAGGHDLDPLVQQFATFEQRVILAERERIAAWHDQRVAEIAQAVEEANRRHWCPDYDDPREVAMQVHETSAVAIRKGPTE